MTKDETLKQAYDALIPLSNAGSPQEREIITDDDQVAAYKAMKAIEQALAQPEQEPIGYFNGRFGVNDATGVMWAGVSIRHALPIAGAALYTYPPQRKPMTKDDVEQLFGKKPSRQLLFTVAAVERRHGIRKQSNYD